MRPRPSWTGRGSWRTKANARFNRGVLFGSALAQWPAWVTGTILGVVLAPSTRLLDATGLDVVFPAFFALLLFDEVGRARSARIAGPACVIAAVVIAAVVITAVARAAL